MTETIQPNANIGLIGLGVMGQNLTLNLVRNSFAVAVYDREPPVVENFLNSHHNQNITGFQAPDKFVRALQPPRKIILLVKAGDPVDWTIDQIKSYLQPGDIIIDGGNSHFSDTERREKQLKTQGLFFIGSGTSGGEKGALLGPSLMPGGDKGAYEQIRPMWEAIAAKVEDGPCVTYVGPGGAGHFVKMVHNGIEYADMQLIAEVYGVMRDGFRMNAGRMGEVFAEWNRGELNSYLIEITAKILQVTDKDTGQPLLDLILDQAEQKGTGKWTVQIASDLGVAIPTIEAATAARNISAQKAERLSASKKISAKTALTFGDFDTGAKESLRDALFASKICAYAQGMSLIRAGSEAFGWHIDLSEMARIWQGGCIIRAALLKKIKDAYLRNANLQNLLLDQEFNSALTNTQPNWRRVLSDAVRQGIPVLAMSASLGYFDMYRSANLPLNLTQAQRDFFGSHTYRRTDKPDLGPIHTEWEE
jgi:6-phosphogluconate dehydrogenase